MDLVEALRTTGAVREFTDEPVDDATVGRLLETARFAPNGGNRQAWRVVVVKDHDVRRAVRDLYLPAWYEYLAQVSAGLTPWGVVTDRELEARAVAGAGEIADAAAAGDGGFAEHLDEVPVMLVLLADLARLATVDRDCGHYTMVGGASIYPFAWSILLAARNEGLAGVMTTMVLRQEQGLRTCSGCRTPTRSPASWPWGTRSISRRSCGGVPSTEFATVDRFDGPPLVAG